MLRLGARSAFALHRQTAVGRVWRARGRIIAQDPNRHFSISTAHRQITPSGGQSKQDARPSQESAIAEAGQVASSDLLEIYRGLVTQGRLQWDDEQVRTIMKLRHLYSELEDYGPPLDLLAKLSNSAPAAAKRAQQQSRTWWEGKGKGKASEMLGITEAEKGLVRVLSGEEEIANLTTPKGIMITGPPGTGKSMVLSLFFDSLPTTHKKRWHYHAFTLYLYRQVFVEMERRRKGELPQEKVEKMEKAAKKGWKSVFAGGRWEDSTTEEGDAELAAYARTETIPFIIARRMILEYHILYFDEMQLVDASSAALLRDVLSWYWRLGGVVITCSNRVPDDLYHHGVQKERMAGFLDSLKARCEVVELDGGRDWRGGIEGDSLADMVKWFEGDQKGFEAAWNQVVSGKTVGPVDIGVYGRRLHVPQAVDGVCRMTFEELCEQPLGPADYISLASTFSTFFIDAVPTLLLKNKNEARRLINLIDALYESRCQLFISSSTALDDLFFPDAIRSDQRRVPGVQTTGLFDHGDTNESIMAAEALSETLQQAAHPNVSLYNPFERETREKKEQKENTKASAFGVLGIWTGEDERFAYKRAVSRMREMTTSTTYAREAWIPLSPEGRIWESKMAPSVPRPTRAPASNAQSSMKADEGDFATEAAYSRPGLLQKPAADDGVEPVRPVKSGSREGAPVIKEEHVWGVEDQWGKKAGKWGKGAKAYQEEEDK